MELKPAREVAFAVMNESSPARIEGLIRARDREVIERCIEVVKDALEHEGPWILGGTVAALEKLKEGV